MTQPIQVVKIYYEHPFGAKREVLKASFLYVLYANTIFYQDKPFIGYPHVQGLYPIGIFCKNWTELSLKYFATVFRQKALSIGFDYGNKFRRDIAVKLYIFLPVDKTGQPDWGYMEEYMRKVEEKTENTLNQFMLV